MGEKFLFKRVNELILDWLIVGQDISGLYVSSHESIGANPVQSTDYDLIKAVLSQGGLEKSDNVTDIGCGMGRFIGYLNFKGFRGRITGIEIDKTYADFCGHIFRKKNNIRILNENAVDSAIDEDDVVYMYNPFSAKLLWSFLDKHRNLKRIIYCNDVHRDVIQNCGYYALEKTIDGHLDDGTPVPISVWVRIQ